MASASSYTSVRVRRAGEHTVRFVFVKVDAASAKKLRKADSESSDSGSGSSSSQEPQHGDHEPALRSRDVPFVLFVSNVPSDMTEDELADAYSSAGRVASVSLSALTTDDADAVSSVRAAHVGFLTKVELERALAVAQLDLPALSDEEPTAGGSYWLRRYKDDRPPVAVLQEHIDAFMAKYDADKAAADAAKRALLNKTDEDGWTVVARGGRKNRVRAEDEDGTVVGVGAAGALGDETMANKRGKSRRMRKKKGEAPPLDFYRFQRREAKRDEIAAMRERFEADKERVAKLKAERKFAVE